MKLAVLAVLAAAMVAGCGGSTNPTGYQCTAPQNPYGCYTQVDFSHAHINPDNQPDIAGDPVAIASDVFIGQLTCDASCQASSGSGNPPGTIGDFVELYQSTTQWFIRFGFHTSTTSPSGMEFYLEYRLDIQGGQYHYWSLGPVPAVGQAGGSTQAVLILGQLYKDLAGGSGPTWVALLGLSTGYTEQDIVQSTGFHPNHAYIGQDIYGTANATATISQFTDNSVFTSPMSFGHLSEYLTEDGVGPSAVGTADHPTYAGWSASPTTSVTGGVFYLYCC